jgi:hypothetical protein
VETRDDVSLLFSPVIVGASPFLRALQVGEGNLGGEAQRAVLRWRDGVGYRDRLGFEYANYLFGAARNELRVNAQRTEFGHDLDVEARRPYYTDLQRTAWVASLGGAREPAWFARLSENPRVLMTDREFAQLGGVARFGTVGRLKLLGLMLTREKESSDGQLLRYTDSALVRDSSAPPLPFRAQNVMRVNGMLGLRAIRFVRVQGFDALTGAQDVRVGGQFGIVAGHRSRSLPRHQPVCRRRWPEVVCRPARHHGSALRSRPQTLGEHGGKRPRCVVLPAGGAANDGGANRVGHWPRDGSAHAAQSRRSRRRLAGAP